MTDRPREPRPRPGCGALLVDPYFARAVAIRGDARFSGDCRALHIARTGTDGRKTRPPWPPNLRGQRRGRGAGGTPSRVVRDPMDSLDAEERTASRVRPSVRHHRDPTFTT